jgi:hypothetical protein
MDKLFSIPKLPHNPLFDGAQSFQSGDCDHRVRHQNRPSFIRGDVLGELAWKIMQPSVTCFGRHSDAQGSFNECINFLVVALRYGLGLRLSAISFHSCCRGGRHDH